MSNPAAQLKKSGPCQMVPDSPANLNHIPDGTASSALYTVPEDEQGGSSGQVAGSAFVLDCDAVV